MLLRTEKEILIGEYFADYDAPTNLYCIFHTDFREGHSFKNYSAIEEAENIAKQMNAEIIERKNQLTNIELMELEFFRYHKKDEILDIIDISGKYQIIKYLDNDENNELSFMSAVNYKTTDYVDQSLEYALIRAIAEEKLEENKARYAVGFISDMLKL